MSEEVEAVDVVDKTFSLNKKVAKLIENEASELGVEESELLDDLFGDGFYVAYEDIEESVVKLTYVEPWSEADRKVDKEQRGGQETNKTLKTYRRLRDTFPPVTAGVEYSKAFTSGGGFQTEITNSKSQDQQDARKIINDFNRDVYQDEVTRGLDDILDILLEDVFTVGCAAAEIVYKKSDEEGFEFGDYASKVEPAFGVDKELLPEYESRKLKDEDWKDLGGIVQLKIVDNAVERLKPYRNSQTYKIEYWTVDEENAQAYNDKASKANKPIKAIPKLLPWQVLWLSWDRRGTDLKGNSLIKPVTRVALLLEEILSAVGLSFKRWSDKKFFFILGSDKTGRSWAKPKVRNFLRDVKKMTSAGGTGIPVPAGFDIKEIGGDVFEGGIIIDSLLTMITAGMRYPRTFIEQGKTQEGDKAWLAWITTYAGHQKHLKRAIEHQLWRRHLQCIVGKVNTKVSKKGVPVDEQEITPIFVPRMAWKSEGKWHIQQKIEQLTKILNTANPVGPEIKTEIEEDLARTLGYSELDLTVTRKVIGMKQTMDVLAANIEKLKSEMMLESLQKAQKENIHLEMVPQIDGLAEKQPEVVEGNPKRPLPVPLKRLEGGVSRSNKETGKPNERGVSKKQGGTRKPNIVQESDEMFIQFESNAEMFDAYMKMQGQQSKTELYTKMIEVLDKM